MSDLKSLQAAVPRNRLLAYAVILALVPALIVWAALTKGGRAPEGAQPPVEDQANVAPGAAPYGGQQGAPRPSGDDTDYTTPFASPPTDWRPATSPDGKLQMDLPPGTKLVQSEGYTYVMPDPAPNGAAPYMAIKLATGADRQSYRPDPATSVILDYGNDSYWLYTWQFKAWDPFRRIVSSFKPL